MKGILEFNLPEDQEAFDICKDGIAWRGVVVEIDNFLRGESKYLDNDLTSVAKLRDKIREICDNNDLKLW